MDMNKDLMAACATPLVLAILAEADSYGYAIIKRVAELSSGHLQWTDGMLYPVLHRLERQGYVAAKWAASENGRRRKYYRITDEGWKESRRLRAEWREFAAGLEAGAGPGLVFQTVPIVFSALPFGSLLAALFFILLAFAALTSSISLLEVVVAYYCDEKKWTRKKATLVMGSIIFLLGVPSALSNNLLKDIHFIGDRNFLDSIDLLATNYLLPLGGLLIALFTGWVLTTRVAKNEIEKGEVRFHLFPVWRFLIKYVSPVLVAMIFLNKIGVF